MSSPKYRDTPLLATLTTLKALLKIWQNLDLDPSEVQRAHAEMNATEAKALAKRVLNLLEAIQGGLIKDPSQRLQRTHHGAVVFAIT